MVCCEIVVGYDNDSFFRFQWEGGSGFRGWDFLVKKCSDDCECSFRDFVYDTEYYKTRKPIKNLLT